MILKFLELLKLRIVFSNLISLFSGFLLASKSHFNINVIFFTLISAFLILSSACMLNNVVDRKLDQLMSRTKNRYLVKYPSNYKLIIYFSGFLGISGLLICFFFINLLCTCLFIIGLIIYNIYYSIFLKKNSIYSTIVGSISGAMPPIIGYCSVTNNFDYCALSLLIVFSLWQVPHSYSIFVMHFNDYKIAHIPVFPIVKGLNRTRIHIICFILMFFLSIVILYRMDCINFKILILSSILCFIWLFHSLKPLNEFNRIIWSKRIFRWSIIVIVLLNVFLSMNYIL